jgi:uncharacterized membrane protein (UPF0127 family)
MPLARLPFGRSPLNRFFSHGLGFPRFAFKRPASAVRHVVAWTLGALLFLSPELSAWAQGEAPSGPQPRLPTVDISAGMHRIRAEVADEPASRMRGLMMRERLGPNEGMLFVFAYKAVHCFWMRNTLIPLSIAFLEEDGTIVNIADMSPQSDQSHCPVQPVRFALEMDRGWFSARGLTAGTKLVSPTAFKRRPQQ